MNSKGNVVSFRRAEKLRSKQREDSADALLDEFVTIMNTRDPKDKKVLFAEWSMRVLARKGELPSQKALTTRQS